MICTTCTCVLSETVKQHITWSHYLRLSTLQIYAYERHFPQIHFYSIWENKMFRYFSSQYAKE